MGSPKALLDYRGETFLGRLVRVMGAVCDPVVVVLGHHAETLRGGVPPSVRIAVNPDPDRGQLSSLQTGLRAIPPEAEGFAFVPVDCPAVAEETIAALGRAFDRRDASTLLVIPRRREQTKYRRGHPVFADIRLIPEFLALPASGEARTIVHGHVERTEYVDVGDPGIFADIDTPEAYRRLRSGLESVAKEPL